MKRTTPSRVPNRQRSSLVVVLAGALFIATLAPSAPVLMVTPVAAANQSIVSEVTAAAILERLAVLARGSERSVEFVERLELAVNDARRVRASAALLDDSERQRQTRMWLELLGLIESSIDPTFDPVREPAPERRVFPGFCDGALIPGIAPESITCPDVRAKYEADLRENQIRHQRFISQHHLHDLQKRVERTAQLVLKAIYIRVPAVDRDRELRPILDGSGLSDSTKMKVPAWLH